MNNAISKLKKAKYISLLALMLLIFSYAAQFRYYINANIYAAFNLGNLGPIGQKLNVSILVAVFCALGWAIGLLTAFLTRKKDINAVTLYWLAGMFAIVALFFTPYNLQLLMPDTILQNIAMIACIAHIVFIFADMWIFAWAFCQGCKDLYSQGKNEAFVLIPSAAVAAMILSYFASAYMWSFSICVSVYGTVLTAINVLHAAFDKNDNCNMEITSTDNIKILTLTGAVTLILMTVIAGAYFITENNIAISY